MPASKHPLLYQVNTRVWLTLLSNELGRPATFDDIPESGLEDIASLGFEWVYFLGVWQTGEAGRNISLTNASWLAEYRAVMPDFTEQDICGSPFAVASYRAHLDFGADGALQRLRHRLNNHGLRLMLDFVPNHTARDHPWVWEHPEFYVPGSEADLEKEPYNFARVETCLGPRILACGRDPYFPGWTDTLQLNYGNRLLQQALQQELVRVAGYCDGLRCDMAMLVLPEIFKRTWGIPIQPFWPVAIPIVRQGCPEFTFMAEVYWDLEATLLEQGFDYAYDKQLYDQLRAQEVDLVREHLQESATYQQHLARFLENHDEARAATAFPPVVHQAAAVLTHLSPGLRFFHQGQLEGWRTKISVHLCRGLQEPLDPLLGAFYSRLLACLRQDVLRNGKWQLLAPQPAWEDSLGYKAYIAYAWQGQAKDLILAVVNFASKSNQCYVPFPVLDVADRMVHFEDLLSNAVYDRTGKDLLTSGLYLDLPAWGHHVFAVSLV